MASDIRIEVAVPCPLRNTFTYAAPADLDIQPGHWVEVSFGRRHVIGLVMAIQTEIAETTFEIKSVRARNEKLPAIKPELLELIRWATRYYHAAPWDVVNSVVPHKLLSRETQQEKFWQLRTETDLDQLARAPKQHALAEWIGHQEKVTDQQITDAGFSAALRRELTKKGLLSELKADIDLPLSKTSQRSQLSQEQSHAVASVDTSTNETYLLIGPTGSGKTEIYLELAQRLIDQGKQVLILVPEIGLTPQTEQRFRQAIKGRIGTYHSGMTDSSRRQVWMACLEGQVDLVIGTRSAIFLPFINLGLIAIDEEHDTSYKQQEGWRYHARQIAAVRAKQLNIPLVMGSATPSLDSLLSVERGRSELLRLTQRHENRPMPTWQLSTPEAQHHELPIAKGLLEKIDSTLKRGGQVLLFLNRRGFAPSFECQNCRWIATCDDCSCRLTAHRQRNALICHHCGHTEPFPKHCEQCQSQHLEMLGVGTERLENFLASQFPDYPTIRVDRDTTKGRGKLEKLLERANAGQPCILVGTQMLAKGHHFPGVTLSIILGVDQGLLSADPCAIEQTAQQCIQVAGRAGRGDRPGEAIIETSLPSHPAIVELVTQGYESFANTLLEERKTQAQPPFSYWSILRAEHTNFSICEKVLNQVTQKIQPHLPGSTLLLGPMPCLLERRGKRFRYQLLIQAPARSAMHQAVDLAISVIEPLATSSRLRWSIDIDPMGMD